MAETYVPLTWDNEGDRLYETGVSNVALYVWDESVTPPSGAPAGWKYGEGVAWNGCYEIADSPDGAETTDIYADDILYLSLRSLEKCKGSIKAYTYPDAWEECDGSRSVGGLFKLHQQPRKRFGLVYKTKIGNDTEGEEHGYKLHIIYGATASPSERTHSTINDSPKATEMSWDFECVTPSESLFKLGPSSALVQYKPTAHIEISSLDFADSTAKAKLTALEAILFGSSTANASLPWPALIYSTLAGA